MADTQQDRAKKDEQIRDTIMAKLVESGEKDKLKEMLRERLVQCGRFASSPTSSPSLFCYYHHLISIFISLMFAIVLLGWRDELKEYCKDVIRKKGLEKVTVEELVAEITPHGRGWIFHIIFLPPIILY